MKTKPVILKKDTSAMEWAVRDLREELGQMQSWLDWFNGLHYVTPITNIEQAKNFLTGTKEFHETAVIAFLKTKTPELPPNLQPLRDAWRISNCDQEDFSEGNPRFEQLQWQDGQLCYDQSVYDQIEAQNTIIATPEQVQALQELERLWANLEHISEVVFPTPGMSRQMWFKEVTDPLSSTLRNQIPGRTPDPSLLTPWKVEALERLAAAGFGQRKTK